MSEVAMLCIHGLNDIKPNYFGLDWSGEGFLNSVEANETTRTTAFKHWERVFCYELYHKIRKAVDKKIGRGENPEYWSRVTLTGELQKDFLKDMTLSSLNLEQLDKRFILDFLIHEIATSDYQELVIEVKTKPNLKFYDIKDDLEKLKQFIEKYNYKLGMFIAANNTFDDIQQTILDSLSSIRIKPETQEKILIVSKFDSHTQIIYKTIAEIIKTKNDENNSRSASGL